MKNYKSKLKNNKFFVKKILFSFLFIIFITHLFFRIYQYRERYLTRFDPGYWEERYNKSQWVDPLSKNPIGDDGLYIYSSWIYINGGDPTLINPEMPFLGKYILGFTILIFQNENIFSLIIGCLTLFIFFVFNKVIFKSSFLALIPVLIFSSDKLFYEQLRAPFFDTLQLLFLLLTFYFYLKKKFIISSVFLGMFASSKFPFMVVIPVISEIFTLLINKNDRRKIYLFLGSLPLALIVYVSTYLRFFLLRNSLIDFLGVQKFILNFYLNGAEKPFPGTVFPLLIQGEWYTHFKAKLNISEWRVFWPVSFFISISALKHRKNFESPIVLIVIWIIVYLIFLSLTPVFPRYLLLLLPFLYNLTVWFIYKSMSGRSFLF